jgi:hypothetical protein
MVLELWNEFLVRGVSPLSCSWQSDKSYLVRRIISVLSYKNGHVDRLILGTRYMIPKFRITLIFRAHYSVVFGGWRRDGES